VDFVKDVMDAVVQVMECTMDAVMHVVDAFVQVMTQTAEISARRGGVGIGQSAKGEDRGNKKCDGVFHNKLF